MLTGLGIIFCWFGMAWAAFNGEWHYLLGYFIVQTGLSAIRDVWDD